MSQEDRLQNDPQALPALLHGGAAAPGTPMPYLGVEAGAGRWLLALDEAQEVVAPGPIVPVPLTRAWFLGLANIRGHLISVVDFSAFMGAASAPMGEEARLVVLAERFHVNAALMVPRTLGLRRLQDFRPVSAAAALPAWAARQYQAEDGQIWQELSVRLLVREPSFLNAGV
jgi:twitching motility protein PilI